MNCRYDMRTHPWITCRIRSRHLKHTIKIQDCVWFKWTAQFIPHTSVFCNPTPHWRVSTGPCQFKNNQTADLLLSSIVFSGLFTHLRSNVDYQLFLNEVYANLPIYFYALRTHGETRDSPKKERRHRVTVFFWSGF